MRHSNALLRKLREGQSECCVWLAIGSVTMAELAIDAGATSIVFDLQHGLWERSSLEVAVGITRNSATVLVRVSDNNSHAICSALDAGAHGILVPMIGSAAAAAAAVAAARYPPRGARSGGGVRPLADFAAYRRFAEREIIVGVMIETIEAAEDADAILSVPGVDLAFIGSGDLALSLEASQRKDVSLDVLIARIMESSKRHCIPCGLFTGDATEARRCLAQGFQFAVAESDLALARKGFATAIRTGSSQTHG
jgi:2-keto-3-deoxy-L-rhamnonate aldolase RhmA